MRPGGFCFSRKKLHLVLFFSITIPVSDSLKCFQCGTPNKVRSQILCVVQTIGLYVLSVQISCEDFLPIPEHYSECEGSTCVSTLGTFHRALVETKECGPGPGQDRREQCGTRQLGGGATVTVCHCGQNFCNKFSVQDQARHTGHWGHWWSQLWDLLQVNI